jgi:hypothetical protein
MEDDLLSYVSQPNCNHKKQQTYTERRFDVLNGFELTFTRCLNCHKIVALKAQKYNRRH